MKISVIIPNYNGEALLEKNLPRVIDVLLKSKYEIELIVTDDGSIDNSLVVTNKILSLVKDEKFTYKVVNNKVNKGFSSNVNSGVDASTGEILLLLNTDIIPENNFLDVLIKHFEDPKVFAVGCMDKSVERGKIILRGRGLGSWQKGFLIHKRGDTDKTNTLWVSCGSGAFRRAIWDKLGGLDSLYNPYYWEDIDLSYRAVKSGYKILFEQRSIVLHEHETGTIKSKYTPFKIKTIAYRNQLIFAWKSATDLNLRLLEIVYMPYHLLKALFRLDLAFYIGFCKALILLPRIIRSSIKAQEYFVSKDKEVIAQIN